MNNLVLCGLDILMVLLHKKDAKFISLLMEYSDEMKKSIIRQTLHFDQSVLARDRST